MDARLCEPPASPRGSLRRGTPLEPAPSLARPPPSAAVEGPTGATGPGPAAPSHLSAARGGRPGRAKRQAEGWGGTKRGRVDGGRIEGDAAGARVEDEEPHLLPSNGGPDQEMPSLAAPYFHLGRGQRWGGAWGQGQGGSLIDTRKKKVAACAVAGPPGQTLVGVHLTSVGIQRTSVGVQRTSVGVRWTSVGVQRTSVGVQRTSVGVQSTSVGVQPTSTCLGLGAWPPSKQKGFGPLGGPWDRVCWG